MVHFEVTKDGNIEVHSNEEYDSLIEVLTPREALELAKSLLNAIAPLKWW